MVEVYCEVTVKGKRGGVKTKALLNSGSDFCALPKEMAKKIYPRFIKEEEFLLADGSVVKRNVYEIEIEAKDSEGRTKRCKTLTTIEDRPEMLLGLDAMDKLKAVLNIPKGKVSFEE